MMFSIIGVSLLVYCFFLINLCFAIKNRDRKYLYAGFLIMASAWIAIRPIELPDFQAYKNYFAYIEPLHNYGFSLVNRHLETGFEYGFVYLVSIVKIFTGNNIRFTWFILTFLSITISIRALSGIAYAVNENDKKYNNDMSSMDGHNHKNYAAYIIAIVIFSTYYLICYQGIAIRAALSMAFFFSSLNFYLRNNYIKTILLFVLSIMMQRIAIVGIIAYIIYRFVPGFKKKKYYIIVVFAFFIAGLLIYYSQLYSVLLQLMKGVYSNVFSIVNYRGYVENISIRASFDKKRIMIILISLFCLYFCPNNEKCMRIFNVLFSGLIVLLLTMNINGSARIYDYLTFSYIPLLILEYMENRNNNVFKIGLNIILAINYLISFRIWGLF